MTKAKISEYDPSASNNTDVNGVNIAEGCAPSGINDAIREVMAALKRFETGSDGDSVTVGGNLVVSGSTTISNTFTASLVNVDNLRLDGNTISSTNTSGNVVIAPNSIGQIIVNAGAVGTPIIAPTGDTNTGIFFPAADTIAFAEGGAEAMRIDSDGDVGIGIDAPAAPLHVRRLTATTNAVTQILRIDSQSSGTPANGIGSGIEFAAETAAGNTEIGATIEAITTDVTGASEDFDLSFKTMAAGAAAAERVRIKSTGDFQFNSGYGSVATAYGCRAWVNFDGTSNSANLTGTYSQTGTTVTVTITAHGYITGNSAYLDFTSGTAVDGEYTVTVVDANTFTVTQASRTTSGNVTDRRNTIRASGNVSTVADNGTGDYTVNFATAMPDANYSICGQASKGSAGTDPRIFGAAGTNPLAGSFEVATTKNDGIQEDCEYVCVSIFR